MLDDPKADIKLKATSILLDYIVKRRDEEKATQKLVILVSSFFEKPFGIDCQSKISAGLALVEVLYGLSDRSLSENDIKILTTGLHSQHEDRLTKIVRTMVLEPLELESLEALNSIQSLTKKNV